jgi:DNA-binding transcriptional LysR family regulator
MYSHLNFDVQRNENITNISSRMAPDDLRTGHISLKEWRILHAVATCGSISNAAEFLHLTRPAISYTISQLEEKLGFSLMQIQGRTSHLTAKGEVLLDRSWSLLKEAKELEEFAERIAKGHEPMIELLVNPGFPNAVLVRILRRFASVSDKQIRLRMTPESEIGDLSKKRKADIFLCRNASAKDVAPPVLTEDYVCVAHPMHPLFLAKGERDIGELERTFRIVHSNIDISADLVNDETWPWKDWRWDVHGLEEAEVLIEEKLGYAWLPVRRVEKRLDAGNLKRVPGTENSVVKVQFFLNSPRSVRADSAIKTLRDTIITVCKEEH